MMDVVLITRLKNAFDQKLAEAFVREAYRVFAIGNFEIDGVTPLPEDLSQARAIVEKNAGKIDLYIDVSDERSEADSFTIRDGLDENVIRNLYEANVLRPMAMLEAFLPLLDRGEGKRLCFLTSAQASVNEARGTGGYAYKLGKAAMHNFFQMISNKLTPLSYSLRVYDPLYREIEPEAAAEGALHYFVRRRGTEQKNPLRDDETRLVFRDALGREHTW
jgi:NAD(P)-dependent dehydrogenase (short-subunit alcohol dehydrogenase family)